MTVKPIIFTESVRPICLPNYCYEEPRVSTLRAAGWGATMSKYQEIKPLREIDLDVIHDRDCEKYNPIPSLPIYKSQICTWSNGKDTCDGDNGGPLIEMSKCYWNNIAKNLHASI